MKPPAVDAAGTNAVDGTTGRGGATSSHAKRNASATAGTKRRSFSMESRIGLVYLVRDDRVDFLQARYHD